MVEDAPHTSSIHRTLLTIYFTIYFVWPRVVTGAAGPAPQPLLTMCRSTPATPRTRDRADRPLRREAAPQALRGAVERRSYTNTLTLKYVGANPNVTLLYRFIKGLSFTDFKGLYGADIAKNESDYGLYV